MKDLSSVQPKKLFDKLKSQLDERARKWSSELHGNHENGTLLPLVLDINKLLDQMEEVIDKLIGDLPSVSGENRYQLYLKIMQQFGDLIIDINKSVIRNLPKPGAPDFPDLGIVSDLGDFVVETTTDVVNTGAELGGELIDFIDIDIPLLDDILGIVEGVQSTLTGVAQAIPDILGKVTQLFDTIISKFSSAIDTITSTDLTNILNMMNNMGGIGGILGAGHSVSEAIANADPKLAEENVAQFTTLIQTAQTVSDEWLKDVSSKMYPSTSNTYEASLAEAIAVSIHEMNTTFNKGLKEVGNSDGQLIGLLHSYLMSQDFMIDFEKMNNDLDSIRITQPAFANLSESETLAVFRDKIAPLLMMIFSMVKDLCNYLGEIIPIQIGFSLIVKVDAFKLGTALFKAAGLGFGIAHDAILFVYRLLLNTKPGTDFKQLAEMVSQMVIAKINADTVFTNAVATATSNAVATKLTEYQGITTFQRRP